MDQHVCRFRWICAACVSLVLVRMLINYFSLVEESRPIRDAARDWQVQPSLHNRMLKSFRRCNISELGPKLKGHQHALFELNGSIMVHVFKAGGSSAVSAVSKHGGIVHAQVSGKRKQLKYAALFNSFQGFRTAIVKTPIERLASSFHEVNARLFWQKNLTPAEKLDLGNQTYLVGMLTRMLTDNFRKHHAIDKHFVPQMGFLVDASGIKLHLDYLGVVDHLPEELEFIFGIPSEEVGFHSGPHSPDATENVAGLFRINTQQLPDELIALACIHYRVDFCCLGFEFPMACQDMHCE